uniref:NADH-ubiquinone oxidoreductase chain 6 n=1 Tax=Sialis melania TaxID=2028691 RepID=A0A8K1T783_9NEOP|nr:NADH dehydrogenase subunit 6 [Sialis melania]
MNQLMLTMITIMNATTFIQMNHPLAMGLCLLIQTILISFITGMIIQTFWFSYILFLIMLGGMLVLFIYMTTLASNEMFSFNNLLVYLIIIMLMMIMSLIDSNMWNINNSYIDMLNTNNNYFIMNMENSLELMKLYNKPTMNMTLILINYLLLTLIIIVKITNIFSGPLRQKI